MVSTLMPTTIEFQKKSVWLELRIFAEYLALLKETAKKQGIPHTRLVCQFIERGMQALQ